jgi:serine/threonine protein kinase
MRKTIYLFTLICSLFLQSVQCSSIKVLPQHVVIKKKIQIDDVQFLLQKNEYEKAAILLQENVPENIRLSEVERLAEEMNVGFLKNAVLSTRRFFGDHHKMKLGITLGDYLEMALYIETVFPQYIQTGNYYLSNEKNHLACDLEYDPETKYVFIVLPNCTENFVGEGAYKVVQRAILYSPERPEVVARSIQMSKEKHELGFMKQLTGNRGIVDVVACTVFTEHHKKSRAIYSRLYNPGSLFDAFRKKEQFSLYEKVRIAIHLMRGLDVLSRQKIAHRDIATKNILVNIPEGRSGRRHIEAAITDFGMSKRVEGTKSFGAVFQGHLSYLPPEGILRKNVSARYFYASDMYATGCVLYHLFHGRTAPWQNANYARNIHVPKKKRYLHQVRKLLLHTKYRTQYLKIKKRSKMLTPKEEFEYCILQMVSISPKERGTARLHLKKLERIQSKVKN